MANSVLYRFQKLADESHQVMTERREPDRIRIQIGSATCEHAAGSREVYEEFQKHLTASGRADIVLHRTGCTGRCSREPIVGVFIPGQPPVKYEKVNREAVHEIFTNHVVHGTPVLSRVLDGPLEHLPRLELLYCSGDQCRRDASSDELVTALKDALEANGFSASDVQLEQASCFGACRFGDTSPRFHLLVRPDKVLYRIASKEDAEEIVREHLVGKRVIARLAVKGKTIGRKFLELYGDVSFFSRQSRIALRHNGVLDPESIDEYFYYRGFQALATVLSKDDRNWVIARVTESKLRGRGGGGFSTGQKWRFGAAAAGDVKYLICNADEGDPGAFMDRSMLESDPFNVIEGMIIGGFAIGATQGYVYVRAEYPLAIDRLTTAITQCRQRGLLGENILDSGFSFDIELRLGAGAFVCGEETALIHSIEGERGQPRIRPPFPSEKGLWGCPTIINNVETFANIPAIINYGAEWFSQIGTEGSGGTKVFALAGKVRHTGLVEVPIGTTLRELVFDIGGGVAHNKRLKAIQTGGPAGGCIPEQYLDTPIDFDTLGKVGSIMGSGGMIVLDEDDCMVDIAKFFITFSQDESCGKCTPCREGINRMLEILERITSGKGEPEDLDKLERLASLVHKSSLCGLGRAAPNPVLSTLRYFREEYLAHVVDRKCPAKKCSALVRYEIDPEKCVGCTACARNCPVACIAGERRGPHEIDQLQCIKCGRCFEVCRFDAVTRI